MWTSSKDGQSNRHGAVRIVVFLALLAALLALLSWLYRPRDNSEEGGMPTPGANGWLSEPVGSIDVFFVGSSEFYSGVAPLRLWDEAGITSYDVATSRQRLYLMDQYVGQILKTRKPKLIVLDAYVMMMPVDVNEAMFNLASRPLPILRWHENWKVLTLEQLRAPTVFATHHVKKGFRPTTQSGTVKRVRYMRNISWRYRMTQLNWYYMQHIREMCREAGVELLILSVPSPKNWDTAKANTLQYYSEKYGVNALDLNLTDDVGIDPTTDYRDNGDHLNGPGAKKVSVYLAKWLREHYPLTDHRGDPDYLQWQEDYKTYTGA